MFERNQAQLNLSGVVGSDWTRGNETVVSGIYDNVSVSAGQFHYQSKGFRENFGVQHDLYDLFAQAALTPELNVQAEFRKRYTEGGDRTLNFDPDISSQDINYDFDQSTARVSLRYSDSTNSDFIGSMIYTNANTKAQQSLPELFGDASGHLNGLQGEGQHVFRFGRRNSCSMP